MMKYKANFWKLWGKPLILVVITLIGLISALAGDYSWDALSWLLLSVPVVIMIHYIRKARTA